MLLNLLIKLDCQKRRKKDFFFQCELTHKKVKKKDFLDPPINFCLSWQWWYYPHRSRDLGSPVCKIFKESALWADSFYRSKCPYVFLSVHNTFSLRLSSFCPHFIKSNVQTFLDFWNPWGKISGKNWFQIWKHLLIKGVKLPLPKVFYWLFYYFWLRLVVFLLPLPNVQCPMSKRFRFLESFGKGMERNGLRVENLCS